jgi:predicted outer membrane protein
MSLSRLTIFLLCPAMHWGQEPPTWDEQARQKKSAKADTKPYDEVDRRFILRALGENWKQVEAGKLAIKKTTSAPVVELAQTLIDEHGKSSEEILALARRKGWDIPAPFQSDYTRDSSASTRSSNEPSRRPAHAPEIQTRGPSGSLSPDTYASMRGEARMSELNTLSGRKFDAPYLRQVITDHEGFAKEAAAAAKSCRDEDLRALASVVLTSVQKQLARAKAVKDSLGAGA